MLVCSIDTQILIFAVQQKHKDGQVDRRERCVRLIEWIAENKWKLVLTSEVVAEYLAGDLTDHSSELKV